MTSLPEAPKKPLTYYFKWRMQELERRKGEEHINDKLKDEWKLMDEKIKEKENKKFQDELKEWK
jgi:hypothetical protein